VKQVARPVVLVYKEASMRLGRPKVALILTDDERVRLDSLAHRSRTAPPLARRARIILACAEGHDNKAVAKRLRMSQTTVCKWRARFVRERLDGLYDEPRPGAPRQISDEQIEQVIVRTLEETPRGQTHWSSRGMAKASGLGRTTVQHIWRAFGLQPHRTWRDLLLRRNVSTARQLLTKLIGDARVTFYPVGTGMSWARCRALRSF
jgi:transposase